MLTYIVRRLLWMIVLLLVISFLTFLIFSKLPSADPVSLRAGRNATPELRASIRHTFGLDKPFLEQYRIYLAKLVPFDAHKGFKPPDFGYSYQNNVSVKSQILDRLPATAGLAIGAVFVWLLVGIPIGIISAVRRGRVEDRLAMGAALVAISAPVYWVGLVSLYLFSKDIGKIPIFDGSGSYPNTGSLFNDPIHVAPTLFLPWIVLATAFAAIYARFLRGNLLEVMAEDYIRTARAKGLKERTVIFRHGVRSAITPIVTILGLDLGILLGGAILTESVFNIPGIGRLAFDSIQKADLPTVEGIVIVGAFFIIALNLVVDILYAFLDPRVRY
ncbi:MAG: ABC transporter permease [Actinobacteria bacterium]|nr:MAG: ABC transporter permease [Actinomycetota bacterium]